MSAPANTEAPPAARAAAHADPQPAAPHHRHRTSSVPVQRSPNVDVALQRDSPKETKLNANAKSFTPVTPAAAPAAKSAAPPAALQTSARPFVPASAQAATAGKPTSASVPSTGKSTPPAAGVPPTVAHRPGQHSQSHSHANVTNSNSNRRSGNATPAVPMPTMPMPGLPMPGMPMPGTLPNFFMPMPGMPQPPGGQPLPFSPMPPGMMPPPGTFMPPPGMLMPPPHGMVPMPGMPGMPMAFPMSGLPMPPPPPGTFLPPGAMPPAGQRPVPGMPSAGVVTPALAAAGSHISANTNNNNNNSTNSRTGSVAAPAATMSFSSLSFPTVIPPAGPAARAGAAANISPPAPSLPPNAPARVSVGNASLAALTSKEPPKFSCVLLTGLPAVGKTALGRELVNSLKTEGMGWAFFSGADFLPEASSKRTFWDTTKEVFDALSKRLDELLEQQKQHRNIKGLVIDKNCKGIEDIYYLNALLKAKSIPFVGIIGMECDDDNILVRRMGGDEFLKEKLKYHRVIHARVISLAKSGGMYRHVDASKTKDVVVQSLRTMVLGCCAQPSVRGVRTHHYAESRANHMIDSYTEYHHVLTKLFELVGPGKYQFPAATDFTPFSNKEMTEKSRVNAIKTRYGARRMVDGQRYILMYLDKKLYLVPPHMRAVLQMPLKAWLGAKLDTVGSFVLEGDLTRLTRERQKEKFLAYDAQFWSEASQPETNALLRMNWTERQAALAGYLCSEEKALYPPETDCLVVHHATEKLANAVELLDSEDYPSTGIVFQPVNPLHRNDHVLVWRQPSCVTVDFRVGSLLGVKGEPTANAAAAAAASLKGRRGSVDAHGDTHGDQPTRVFTLEVYDKVEKRYEQFENATVEVRHPDVVAGSLITCSLKDEVVRSWLFNRIRYDVLRPAYKHDVEDLLAECLVPRAKLVSWLVAEHMVSMEIPKDVPPPPPPAAAEPPPPPYVQATAALAAKSAAATPGPVGAAAAAHYPTPSALLNARAVAGGAPPPPPPPHPQAAAALPPPPMPPPSSNANPAEQIQMLASMVPTLHVVRSGARKETPPAAAPPPPPPPPAAAPAPSAPAASTETSRSTPHPSNATGGASREHPQRSDRHEEGPRMHCAQCRRSKQREDLRMDRRDKKYYCYPCWARIGWGFCTRCGEFKEGRGHTGSFVCGTCAASSKDHSNSTSSRAANGRRDGEGRRGGSTGAGAAAKKKATPASSHTAAPQEGAAAERVDKAEKPEKVDKAVKAEKPEKGETTSPKSPKKKAAAKQPPAAKATEAAKSPSTTDVKAKKPSAASKKAPEASVAVGQESDPAAAPAKAEEAAAKVKTPAKTEESAATQPQPQPPAEPQLEQKETGKGGDTPAPLTTASPAPPAEEATEAVSEEKAAGGGGCRQQ